MSSSSMISSIPILTGPNYQEWAPAMRAYLRSQDQWLVTDEEEPKGEYDIISTETVTKQDSKGQDYEEETHTYAKVPNNIAEIKEFRKTNSKALGNITLCLSPAIQYKYREQEDSGTLWQKLEDKYGAPGVVAVYVEFKSALDLVI